jgi:hypothetical protein
VIVLAAGAPAAFLTNSLAYLPLLTAFLVWRRKRTAPRLPPERIDRAIVAGARYALHSSPVRAAMVRAFSFGLAGAAGSALVPLVARDLLKGNASAFLASGVALILTPLIGLLMPMRHISPADVQMIEIGTEPEVALAITPRSGPIAIEIDYRVDPGEARRCRRRRTRSMVRGGLPDAFADVLSVRSAPSVGVRILRTRRATR